MKNTTNKCETFKNKEIFYSFIDNNSIMKIAGENTWYVVDSDNQVLVRTKPNRSQELAIVNFYDMIGEPYDFNISYLQDGIIVINLLCEKKGKTYNNYYEISPSGYTYNATKIRGGLYTKLGVNYRYDEKPTSIVNNNPIDMQNIKFDTLDSMEYLNVVYDVAQHRLMQEYNKIISQNQTNSSNAKKQIIISMAKDIANQYDIFKAKFDRKKAKTRRINKPIEKILNQPE